MLDKVEQVDRTELKTELGYFKDSISRTLFSGFIHNLTHVGIDESTSNIPVQYLFGEQYLGQTKVFMWHARFKVSQTSFDDDKHTARSLTWTTLRNVTETQQFICENEQLTMQGFQKWWELCLGSIR